MVSFKQCMKTTLIDNKIFKIIFLFLALITTLTFTNNLHIKKVPTRLDVAINKIESLENEIESLKEEVANKETVVIKLNNEVTSQFEEDVRLVSMNQNNVTEKSNITEQELFNALENTNLQDMAKTFIQCEEEYNVNAVFLASLVAVSSDNGNAERTFITNNMTSMGVNENNPYGYSYNSKEESIIECAKLLAESYLIIDGDYYNGTSVFDVGSNYCPSQQWVNEIIFTSNTILNNI